MKNECIFCKRAHDPETLEWENDDFAAFMNIRPEARIHALIVPKNHTDNIDTFDANLGSELISAIQQVSKKLGIDGGYSIRINVGESGGQEINHLHVHLLAR